MVKVRMNMALAVSICNSVPVKVCESLKIFRITCAYCVQVLIKLYAIKSQCPPVNNMLLSSGYNLDTQIQLSYLRFPKSGDSWEVVLQFEKRRPMWFLLEVSLRHISCVVSEYIITKNLSILNTLT